MTTFAQDPGASGSQSSMKIGYPSAMNTAPARTPRPSCPTAPVKGSELSQVGNSLALS
jgi:hypothetical protein